MAKVRRSCPKITPAGPTVLLARGARMGLGDRLVPGKRFRGPAALWEPDQIGQWVLALCLSQPVQ